MAISTLPLPVSYNLNTALGAHQAMLALHGHLMKVGLSRATTGTDYDVLGDETQIPTTLFDTSGWLAYNFTDAAQSDFPITVWFRIIRSYWAGSATGSQAWGFQVRVSEGQAGGAPLGANLEIFDGVSNNNPSNGNTYPQYFYGSQGDFVRYSENALTVLFGLGMWSNAFGYGCALVELHIERRYSAVDGSVGRGFCGWFAPGGPGQTGFPMWAYSGATYPPDPGLRGSCIVSSGDSTNIFMVDTWTRPTTPQLMLSAGAAVVMPVLFLDQDTRPVAAGKMFTAPYSAFTQRQATSLDFSGATKKYFPHRPQSGNIRGSSFTYLFEWE